MLNHFLSQVTLPMAQPSQVEGRLRTVLAPDQDRNALPRPVRVFAAVATLGLTALLAALRPGVQAQQQPVTPVPKQFETQQIIVVDAGHGGQDTGALAADGTREKDLNLAVAGKLRDTLTLRGATVAMTRTADVFLTAMERPAFANKRQAQAFVSLHVDSSAKPNSHTGITVWYHGQDALGQRLASDVLAYLSHISGLPAVGIKSDLLRFRTGYGVLRGSQAPAVMVECGYMTNMRDVAALRTAPTQQRIAEGIADGIRDFLSDNPSPVRNREAPTSLFIPVQQSSSPLPKTTPAQVTSRLKRIYGFIQSYRRTHAGAYPATMSSPGDLMDDMAAYPRNYGLPERGADNGNQATDFFTLTDPHDTGPPDVIRIFMHGKRPDGTRVGSPKRPGTRDVLADTNFFVENRKSAKGWRTVGYYLVLWDDGTLARIPVDKMLRVPLYDPIGVPLSKEAASRTPLQLAFPGQAGLPAKGVRKLL